MYINSIPATDEEPGLLWVGKTANGPVTESIAEFLDNLIYGYPISFDRDGADDPIWIDEGFIRVLADEYHFSADEAVKAARDVFNVL